MLRRTLLLLLPAVILTVVCGATSFAQITAPVPTEGVKGYGAIPMPYNGNLGKFDISVGRSGDVIFGGFRYDEVSPDGTVVTSIFPKAITGLTVRGNFATITAVGYWNGMPANITIEALDDLSGDWFHINAVPQGAILIIYDRAGGVLPGGEIVVFSSPPAPAAYAKGEGTIAVYRNIGKFSFSAETTNSGPRGTVYYVEYSPTASITSKPKVRIYVPQVQQFEVTGNTAVLRGKGTFNGRAAWIEVRAIDNEASMLPVVRPDEFYIRALPLATDTWSSVAYNAGGPLTSGDIVVRTANTP